MAIAPRRSPRRPWGALTLLALLIAGLAWVLYLRVTDQPMRDPFGFYTPDSALANGSDANQGRGPIEPPAEGMVRTLISARPIQAYARVTREDLFNPQTASFAYVDVKKEFAEDSELLRGTSEIIGRVMRRPKRPGFAFTEQDFLPKGTRPGLAAGIPAGKRALRIDVELVRGIIGLNPGDRFDLVAAQTVEPPVIAKQPAASKTPRTPAGRQAALGVYASLLPRPGDVVVDQPAAVLPPKEAKAKVEVVVQGGVVVSGLETRLIPTSSASLTSGQINGTRPVQEMVIALAPEEVAPLMGALRMEADLTCVARSGRPEDDEESLTPGLVPDFPEAAPAAAPMPKTVDAESEPRPEVKVVEKIVGGVRSLVAVPRPASRSDKADSR